MTRISQISDARVFTLTLLTLIASTACGGHDTPLPPPSPVLTTLTVSLAAPVIEVGEMTSATAAGLDQGGNPIATGTVTWTSSAPTIAAVNPTTGAVLGVGLGTARIIATAAGQQTAMQIITVVDAAAIKVNESGRFVGRRDSGWSSSTRRGSLPTSRVG